MNNALFTLEQADDAPGLFVSKRDYKVTKILHFSVSTVNLCMYLTMIYVGCFNNE